MKRKSKLSNVQHNWNERASQITTNPLNNPVKAFTKDNSVKLSCLE
jgi:hypothetical protein